MKKYLIGIGAIAIAEGVWTLMGGKVFLKSGGGWTNHSDKSAFIIIIIGILFLLASKFYPKTRVKKIGYSKCPKCKEVYSYQKLEDGICPKCKIESIDLNKYFELYPDDDVGEK